MTKESSAERNLGILVLCSVPLAWGTFEPAVRYVYTIKPAVPGFVFSVGYYMVAAVALFSLASLSMARQELDQSKKYSNATADTSSSLPVLGGIELGTYLFLGNGLQVLGLKTVPSDRAAFLLQLTTVSVFLLDALLWPANHLCVSPLDLDLCSTSTSNYCWQYSSDPIKDVGSLLHRTCRRSSHESGSYRNRCSGLF